MLGAAILVMILLDLSMKRETGVMGEQEGKSRGMNQQWERETHQHLPYYSIPSSWQWLARPTRLTINIADAIL